MKNKPRVVIDTHVFVNSLFKNEYFYCDIVISLIEENKLDLLFSQETIGELMHITKNFALFNIDEEEIRLSFLCAIAGIYLEHESVNTLKTTCPEIKDKSDKKFLKCAIEGNADFLITDDFRHGMHNNKAIEKLGVQVVTSKDFLTIYEGKYNY